MARVLFVVQGRAPERHDTIAHVLVDCPAVFLDCARERRQKLVHHLREFTRIEALGYRREIAYIRKQHGHLARFALE